jgi:single-strand DNA-binding protein
MEYINKVTLQGTLVKDAELRTVGDGIPKASFLLLTVEKWSNGKEAKATHTCVAWRKTAEECKDLREGDWVSLEGSLGSRSFQDREGNTKWVTEVTLTSLQRVGERAEKKSAKTTYTPDSKGIGEGEEDDLPW